MLVSKAVFLLTLFSCNSSFKNNLFKMRTINLSMKKEKYKPLINSYVPKSLNQQKYVDCLNNDNCKIVIVVGPAGTGKTLFACLKAINLLKAGSINKIVITRPTVTVEEDLGFLPGNINKKMDPWTRPIFDLFSEHYSKAEVDNLLLNGIIEISPLAFMRGRTFKRCIIIADEMQNSSPNQMKMLTTRIGINTRMIITGDLNQSDLGKDNGLLDITNKIQLFDKYNNNTGLINYIELNRNDVERSEIVKKMIEIYDYKYVAEKNELVNITDKKEIKVEKIELDNDAALIPKHHLSPNWKIEFKLIK